MHRHTPSAGGGRTEKSWVPTRLKGLFGELPWWSLDAGRQSSELAAAGAHGHEGWGGSNLQPLGSLLLALGLCWEGVVIRVEEGDGLVWWSSLETFEPFLFQW